MEYIEQFGNDVMKLRDGTSYDSIEGAECILHSLSDLVVAVDQHFVPQAANNSFLQVCGIAGHQLGSVGTFFELADGLWDVPEVRKTLMTVADAGVPAECEFQLDISRERCGTWLMKVTPLQPESQYPGHHVISLREVTDRKKMENMRRAVERIDAFTELADGVSHTFNNLLQVVVSGLEVATMELDSGKTDGLRQLFQKIMERSLLGQDIVKNLCDFVRLRADNTETPPTIIDLSRIVRKASEIINLKIKGTEDMGRDNILISTELSQECFSSGREKEILETVVDLLINAVEAMPLGGRIALKTFAETEEVVLVVQDQGLGIAPEHISKVFLPLWSTKGFRSHGMGLARAHATITKYGGSIAVESREQLGTTFICRLPRAHPGQTARSAEVPGRRNFRILVIDDQEPVVSMLEEGLTHFGQTVFTALSGRAGLQVFQEVLVDAVVCDLGMDDMSGWEVAKAMKRLRFEKGLTKVPFILLTGWSGQESRTDLIVESGVDRIIQKPTAFADLLRIINELTGSPREFAQVHEASGAIS